MTESAAHPSTPLPPGTRAPPFTLPVTPDQKLSLDEFAGAPLVLVFYPADFSPVCSDEVVLFNELLPEFERHGARVLGLSCDGVWCHLAFARERNLHFPLLSDFHPHGEISKRYQAFREDGGVSERALFVIDSEGRIFWSYRSPLGINPGAEGVLDALDRLAARAQLPPPPQRQEEARP